MATLYGYSFNTEKHIMSTAEVEVNETEKQYSVDRNGKALPFLYKHKLLKSEIGTVNNGFYNLTVYLNERDSIKAKQIIRDYIKARLEEHEKQVARYQACVDSMIGSDADAEL